MPYFCIQKDISFLSGEVAAVFPMGVAYQVLGEGKIMPEKLWSEAEVEEPHDLHGQGHFSDCPGALV